MHAIVRWMHAIVRRTGVGHRSREHSLHTAGIHPLSDRSHGTVTTVIWAVVVGPTYAVSRYRRSALIAGVAGLSQWLLDALAHRPICRCTHGRRRSPDWPRGTR